MKKFNLKREQDPNTVARSLTSRQHKWTACLGLWAMLLVFAAPLYAQLRALEQAPFGAINLQGLHCGSTLNHNLPSQPEWITQLEQCGYCQLLLKSPPIPLQPVNLHSPYISGPKFQPLTTQYISNHAPALQRARSPPSMQNT